MRHRLTPIPVVLLAALGTLACSGNGEHSISTTDEPVNPTQPTPAKAEAPTAVAEPPPKAEPPPDPLRPRDDLPPERRVVLVIDGKERIVDRDAAVAAGYTVVDFADDWTPFIFEQREGPDGEVLENRYREIFIGLANDRTDGDGMALPKNELNFLEVFGIPPSLGVLRKRVVADAESKCHAAIDYDLIASVDRIPWLAGSKKRKYDREVAAARRKVQSALKEAKLDDMDALAARSPELADEIELVQKVERRKLALAEIEKRMVCDDHDRKRFKHKKGEMDHGLRLALRRFQRKHKIYEYSNLTGETMEMLGRPPLMTNYLSFQRALTERVIAATYILEDGTAQVGDEAPTFTGADGQTHPVRNLVEEFVAAAQQQLQLDTPERVQAFFLRHAAEDFEWLRVGVKFPEKPEYYAEHMDLSMVIDRGDVWYDIPYNDAGKEIAQPRARMPKLALYLNYLGQRIRLVRWPTTIGGWRTEQASDGYVYLRYKGSDVGERVIRKVISGPTWVPPESTPLDSLAKRKWVNGGGQGVVNYEEMGPGYLSAYGLVAGYFVIPGTDGRNDVDRGIRAHGSSDYMSILSSRRFSHGCHRLMNHHAVRLYGFVLNHRHHAVDGDQRMSHHRQFLYKDSVYEVRLPSRGFQYTLDPPLPVTVLEGRIRGKATKPIEGFVRIPGQEYPNEMPGAGKEGTDSRAGGGSGATDDGDDA